MATGEKSVDVAVVGGGAAGFFAAITAAERRPQSVVVVLERSPRFLAKVRISGGGRCNVTHACYDPAELASHYPRGARELRGAFHRWQPRDTVAWFESRGVTLKTEADGRIFPVSDDSATIVDCLLFAARGAGVRLRPREGVREIDLAGDGFRLGLMDGTELRAARVMMAPGSLTASPLAESLAALGHTIEPLAPSLFSLHVSDERIRGLSGISVPAAQVRVVAPKAEPRQGPVLITHEGFSGPAILRLSAWEARRLRELGYRFEISVRWLADRTRESLAEEFHRRRSRSGGQKVKNSPLEGLPRRLWENLCRAAGVGPDDTWARLRREREGALLAELDDGRFAVSGKTMNKEEFVTCGGVRLREVDFRTLQSRVVPGLYFGGECLDLDGITGGFNFQAAWTTGRIAGEAMAADSH